MQKGHEWEIAGEAAWGVALLRESVIRPLAEHSRLCAESVAEAADQLGLSRTILYKLLQRYRRRPQTSSLLPWKRGRKPVDSLLGEEREALLNTCIDEFYLQPERPSLAALQLEVRRRFTQRSLAVPNYRTVKRRTDAVDARIMIRRRDGAKKARERFGPVSVSTLVPNRALEVVQIDHTPVDVIVVDRENRQPIGRPWLTLAVDVKTRMIVGFHVSLWSPSALSVSLALTHAVLEKTSWLADRELQTLEWPVSGLPQILHVDNAREFHSEALVRGCQEYGIRLDHRPVGRPHFGGHIERLIGTMMGAVHLLPGTTFSDVKQKGCYPSEARAILTLSELERWLALQIAGVYQLTPHSSLGTTPLAAWQEAMGRSTSPARKPADPTEFFLSFLPAVSRQVRRDGIHLWNIRYWDNVLSPWAGRMKNPLLVKYDPRDLSRVYLRDPDGRHWPVPYADLGQPPIALWELQEANRRIREVAQSVPDQRSIFASIQAQRLVVQQAATSSRRRRRQEKTPSSEGLVSVSSPHNQSTSSSEEIKPFPVELWEFE
jgi:putative transposase